MATSPISTPLSDVSSGRSAKPQRLLDRMDARGERAPAPSSASEPETDSPRTLKKLEKQRTAEHRQLQELGKVQQKRSKQPTFNPDEIEELPVGAVRRQGQKRGRAATKARLERVQRRVDGQETTRDICTDDEEDVDRRPPKRARTTDGDAGSPGEQMEVETGAVAMDDSTEYTETDLAVAAPPYTGALDIDDETKLKEQEAADQFNGLEYPKPTTVPPRPASKQQFTDFEKEQKEIWLKKCKAFYKRQENIRYGVLPMSMGVNMLTIDQVAPFLLRPISDTASPDHLIRILSIWQEVVQLGESNAKSAMERVDMLFHCLSTAGDIETRHTALLAATERLREMMGRNRMLDIRQEKGRQLLHSIDGLQSQLDVMAAVKYAAMDLVAGTKTYLASKIAKLATIRSTAQQLKEENANAREQWTDFAQLLDRILERAKFWKLVRIEGRVYEPVYTKDGHFTRHYKEWRSGEILEFVHQAANPSAELAGRPDPELYGMLYGKGSYWKQVVEILKYNYDDRFPEKSPSRYWFAWNNGLYNIQDDRFVPYNSLAFRYLPEEVVCCNYFDQTFENEEYEWWIHNSANGWYDIPTPPLEAICEVQGWSQDEREWWYAGGGRMLFPIGERENWCKMWLHLGRAGTGKTTWLKFLAGFLPKYRVGIVNNNCERIFTIQHLEHTWAWFGFDIKENWNMDQTLWNTLVEGGITSFPRKFMMAKITDFQQHGAVASNRLMNWPDINGQFLRRLFPHIYRVAPPNMGNPDLPKIMEKCRAAAMKKLVAAYKAKAAKHTDTNLCRSNLPPSVVASLALIRREANPLMAFLDSDRIVLNPNYYMERRTFVREFAMAAQESGIRGGAKQLPSVSDAFFADVLEDRNLKMVFDVRPEPNGLGWPNNKARPLKRGFWIVGCTTRELEDRHPNYTPPVLEAPTSSSAATAAAAAPGPPPPPPATAAPGSEVIAKPVTVRGELCQAGWGAPPPPIGFAAAQGFAPPPSSTPASVLPGPEGKV
jgi:hypothetical protein